MVDAMEAVTGTNKSSENPDGIVTVACGGDTLAAAYYREKEPNFTHLSTGGGAALELLEGLILPGVDSLTPMNSEAFQRFCHK
jgi:phosphoglycerate kinase